MKIKSASSHGDTKPCVGGECVPTIDCIGSWSKCGGDCLRTYNRKLLWKFRDPLNTILLHTITTPKQGQGSECAHNDGLTDSCDYGTDDCEEPVPDHFFGSVIFDWN